MLDVKAMEEANLQATLPMHTLLLMIYNATFVRPRSVTTADPSPMTKQLAQHSIHNNSKYL